MGVLQIGVDGYPRVLAQDPVTSVSDPYLLNPDPFLTLTENNTKYFIIIRFSHQRSQLKEYR